MTTRRGQMTGYRTDPRSADEIAAEAMARRSVGKAGVVAAKATAKGAPRYTFIARHHKGLLLRIGPLPFDYRPPKKAYAFDREADDLRTQAAIKAVKDVYLRFNRRYEPDAKGNYKGTEHCELKTSHPEVVEWMRHRIHMGFWRSHYISEDVSSLDLYCQFRLTEGCEFVAKNDAIGQRALADHLLEAHWTKPAEDPLDGLDAEVAGDVHATPILAAPPPVDEEAKAERRKRNLENLAKGRAKAAANRAEAESAAA